MSREPFSIVEVSSLDSEDLEQLGTKPKYWFRDGERRLLFKAENRGTGEDWAERIACEICLELGIPHVPYELAFDTHQELPGVVCENIAGKPLSLILGNQLMLEIDPLYPSEEERRYKVSEHTVDAVWDVVGKLDCPSSRYGSELPAGVHSAGDVFIGYVLLDALIANQDRHHQNWGAIRGTTTQLAPTFDHGAGLARNESDEKRQRRLQAGDAQRQIDAYAGRARSAFYTNREDLRTLTTHDAAVAFIHRNVPAGLAWLKRIEGLNDTTLAEIVRQVPDCRMSLIAQSFTIELLISNRSRLLKLIGDL